MCCHWKFCFFCLSLIIICELRREKNQRKRIICFDKTRKSVKSLVLPSQLIKFFKIYLIFFTFIWDGPERLELTDKFKINRTEQIIIHISLGFRHTLLLRCKGGNVTFDSMKKRKSTLLSCHVI